MIQHTRSRLAVAAVLLALQSGIFVFELLVFAKAVRRDSWYRPLRQLIGPVSIAILITIRIPIMFANASRNVDGAAQECSASVDGDIAGQGAQIAVWAQVGVLLVISVLGSFHTSATGAKEVGAGLVLTHVSLSVALLAQMGRGTLSSADAVVGAKSARWDIAKDTLLAHVAGDYVLCFTQNHDPSFLTLGAMLTEPLDATSQVGAEHAAPDRVQTLLVNNQSYSQSVLSKAPGFESSKVEEISMTNLLTSSFDPRELPRKPYITDRLKDPLIVAAIKRLQAVYMVTGIKVAAGLTISKSSHVSYNMHAGAPEAGPLEATAGVSHGNESRSALTTDNNQVLFAYQLHIFRWSRRRGKFVDDGVYMAEEDW